MKTWACVVSYLGAVIAANGLVTVFGQIALPLTAFVLIAFDLLARDVLHEKWRGRSLWPNMFLLVSAGSFLSYASAIASPRVSLASAVSFMVMGLTDVFIYWLLDNHPKVIKMNGSNLISAIVDSLLFPTLAFGMIIPWMSLAQAISKFTGGFLWTALFLYLINRRASSATDYKEA